jgi:SAM-dependent methyltransferase
MRDVAFEGEFDAVLNLFSSFGYLETVDDDQRVLDAVARALKPGGTFLIDVLNLHWLVGHPREAHSFEGYEGAPVLERRVFDPVERLSRATWTFLEADGVRRELVLTLRVYGPRELAAMLDQAGLVVEGLWGSFVGAAFSREASRMIVLARRPARTAIEDVERSVLPPAIGVSRGARSRDESRRP